MDLFVKCHLKPHMLQVRAIYWRYLWWLRWTVILKD